MLLFGTILLAVSTLIIYTSYLLFFSFILWMAVDAAKQDRFFWVVVVLGVPFIGAVAYYFTEKKHDYAHAESHHIHTSETEAQHEVAPKKKRVTHRKEVVHKEVLEKEAVQETPVAVVEEEGDKITEEVTQEEKKDIVV